MKRNISTAFLILTFAAAIGKENTNVHRLPAPAVHMMAGCEVSKSSADLDINNVRTRIWINGDMWWDLSGTAIYEVPKGSKKNSMFAGAIWIGGKDIGGNLKVAAQTYRQSGSDFWPGAIDTSTTTISAEACLKADKHYKITLSEVKNFHEEYQLAGNANYPIPQVIKDWPGNGDVANYHQALMLAPFYDRAGDGIYDYNDGDYPKYRIDASIDACDKNLLLGDQTIWWVFNDVGNIHDETNSPFPIGVEIQAQAFGFSTNDEINNMTFYRYKIINRATSILYNTYFGSWVDPDLGFYLDDYVGCDVGRGLGFCYNGDADDEGAAGYGKNPPAIGLDFFEGPIADALDGKDNNRNGDTDEVNEQIIMAKFVYYNNDFSNTGNPNNATDYYNYLDGIWKDGSSILYGGTGYQSGGDTCDFMFPGNSDPKHYGTKGINPGFDWSEVQPNVGAAPNNPSDRRFLQSAGKFTLQPGAVNFITTGAVWARTSSGGPEASVKLLKLADVKAQNLFEACFKVLDGPDAPDLSVRELDKEIIISLSNDARSNNANEGYTEKDINIPSDLTAIFKFEGYKVFQLVDQTVSITELLDADRARQIFQCDIVNGVSQIVNQVLDGDLNAPVPTEMVIGADKGLKHSFRITQDAFASGNSTLINHKTYYYMAVAYAYDPVADVFDILNVVEPGLFGQPYIQSRKNADGTGVRVYTAIPHIPDPEALGLDLGTVYDDGPEITRYTGIGNGYILGSDRGTLDLKQDQINDIIFAQGSNKILHPVYERGRGPIDVRVYDPVKVPPGDFELWLTDTITKIDILGDLTDHSDRITNITSVALLHPGLTVSSSFPGFPKNARILQINGTGPYEIVMSRTVEATDLSLQFDSVNISITANWVLKNVANGRMDTSEKSLELPYDQLTFEDYYGVYNDKFSKYGFSVSASQVKTPGEDPVGGNASITGTIVYDNPSNRWFGSVPDVDGVPFINWINSGKSNSTLPPDKKDLDDGQYYEKILGGTWAPFKLVNSTSGPTEDYTAPAPGDPPLSTIYSPQYLDSLMYVGSVDVVITPDRSKWSRCVVFEMGNVFSDNEGGQYKNLIRKHPSMNLDGTYSTTDSGFSYFPGYAINIETGERLNIAFGEDSHLPEYNGNDMIWNPTTVFFDTANFGRLINGGKHYIYVFGHKNPETLNQSQDASYYGPAYDGCQYIHDKMWGITIAQLFSASSVYKYRMSYPWKDCMWVNCPLLNPGQTLLDNAVKIRLRVAKPYRQFDTGVSSVNNNFPYYKFNTYDLAAKIKQEETAKEALNLINVVPNPYYAYSNYETNQLDNRVKIVNLPPKCVISIYTPAGTLVRRFNRDIGSNNNYDNTGGGVYPEVNIETSQDWDLKNTMAVPIASGMYLIHVEAEGIGERTIKWFGVIRPIDLDTF